MFFFIFFFFFFWFGIFFMPLKVLKVAFFVYRLVVAWCTKVQHLKCLRIFSQYSVTHKL